MVPPTLIIPASVTVTPDSGNFRWTYSIVLPTNMMLQSGNFFTIYDTVNGLVPGSIQAPDRLDRVDRPLNVTPPAGLHPPRHRDRPRTLRSRTPGRT